LAGGRRHRVEDVRAHTTGTCKADAKHPKGATAKGKDGTYGYSANFSGTCSHPKGVHHWYR
jgi:hypothetical protein